MRTLIHVVGVMDIGGIESLLMTLFRASMSQYADVIVVQHGNRNAYYADELHELGIRLVCCPRFSPGTLWTYGRWWKAFLNQFPSRTIIHCHVRSTAAIILRLAAQKGIRTIAHSHGMSHGQGIRALVRRFLSRRISRHADVCLACSKEAGLWLFGEELVEKGEFHVIRNPIDLERFTFSCETRKQFRRVLQLSNDKLCLMHVGRFTFEKNHMFLIEMMARAQKRGLDHWVLYLVGSGPLLDEIKQRCRRLQLSNVVFLGNRDDVPELLQACDIFLFPSTFEGLGTALVEAQATGVPCIVSPAISQEAVMTSLVQQLALDYDQWIDGISQYSHTDDRFGHTDDVVRAGYDLESVIRAYRSIYERLYTT